MLAAPATTVPTIDHDHERSSSRLAPFASSWSATPPPRPRVPVSWPGPQPIRQLAQVELVTGAGCGLVLGGYQDLAFGLRDVDRDLCGRT